MFCFVPLAEWVMSPWIVGFERGRLCCGSSAIVRRCGVVAPCCLYDVDCMTYMMPANNYYLCACFFQSSRFIQGLVAIYLIGSVLWIDTAVSVSIIGTSTHYSCNVLVVEGLAIAFRSFEAVPINLCLTFGRNIFLSLDAGLRFGDFTDSTCLTRSECFGRRLIAALFWSSESWPLVTNHSSQYGYCA